MKGELKIREHDIDFMLDNISVDQYKPTHTRLDGNGMIIKEGGKSTVTLVTSNLPPPLIEEIRKVVENYLGI